MFLNQRIETRISDECKQKIEELLKKYPGDYKTSADVIRAGIIRLHAWRTAKISI